MCVGWLRFSKFEQSANDSPAALCSLAHAKSQKQLRPPQQAQCQRDKIAGALRAGGGVAPPRVVRHTANALGSRATSGSIAAGDGGWNGSSKDKVRPCSLPRPPWRQVGAGGMAKVFSGAPRGRLGLKKKGRKRCLSPSTRPPWNPDTNCHTNCQDFFETGRDKRKVVKEEGGREGGREGGWLCAEEHVLRRATNSDGRKMNAALGTSAPPPILARQQQTHPSHVFHTHADHRSEYQTFRFLL
jgi:hypothetical protein